MSAVLHISFHFNLKFVYKNILDLKILSAHEQDIFLVYLTCVTLFVVLSVTVHRLGTEPADCSDEVIITCSLHEFLRFLPKMKDECKVGRKVTTECKRS